MPDNNKIPCSVEILTLNAEKTLPALLVSLKDFAEIIVLDGGSADRTRQIALAAGSKVIPQTETPTSPGAPITDFAAVRNKGLAAATQLWFMFVDSDEIVSPELAEEIRAVAATYKPQPLAYWVPRKYVMGERVIEYSITYPAKQVRFFRRDAAREFVKPVHERIILKDGVETEMFHFPIFVPQADVFFPRKWFLYLKIEAPKYKNFSFVKCLKITAKRLMLAAFYIYRYLALLLSGKQPRAPWRHELSYIVYNFVHVYFMWRSWLRG